MKAHASALLIILAATVSNSGCQTTGDPTKGGLFGWSETQAKERQDQKRAEAAAVQQQAASARAEAAALQLQERELGSVVQREERQLRALLEENAALDAQLRDLIAKRNLKESERERLQSLLQRSRNARTSQERVRSVNPTAPPTEPQLGAIEAQNRLLHREVMLLLGH